MSVTEKFLILFCDTFNFILEERTQMRGTGYCQIFSAHQNIDRQVRNILKEYPDAEIVKEVYTGTKFQGRNKLNRILEGAREGDTIVFDSVSRMSRDAEEGFQVNEDLYNRGVTLVFLKEPQINTDTYKKALENRLDMAMAAGLR